jgi:MFS family permease
MTAPLLIAFTFALGSASVFANPAFQSLIPDIVPREQLRAAAALGSISINLSRVVGPALAGLVIARLGIAAVFGLNALTYLLFVLVVAIWKPPARPKPPLPEHFFSAIRAGGRYVRNAPVVRRILLRMALYMVPASVLWSLLPLLAAQRLHLGAIGYGLLQGSLGVGAVAGALALVQIRNRLSDNGLMAVAGAAYAIALVLVAAVPIPLVALIVLLPAGAAWVLVLSNVNAAVQLFLPAWVRARGVSVYLMLLFGTQALGSVLWGAVAEWMGVVAAFLIAAAALIIGLATIRLWPFYDVSGLDRNAAPFWPEPQLAFDVAPNSGPVMVETAYSIAPDREEAFLEAMIQVRLSRLRTGASRWVLYRDGEKPHSFVETFVVASWEEHLRQHRDRLTGADRDFDAKARGLSDPPSQTRHLIAADG